MNDREIRNAESLVSKLPRHTLPQIPILAEKVEAGQKAVCEFAKKLVEQHKDLLKRLADR